MADAMWAHKVASTVWLAIIVTTLLSPLPVSCGYNSGIQCPERSNCSCLISGYDFDEVVCPMTGPSLFILSYVSGKSLRLQCMQNVKAEDYGMLPPLTIHNPKDEPENFSFASCPLPDTPFADIVTKLGISKLRSLIFQTFNKNIGNTLKKYHFKGLEGVTRLVLASNGLTDLPEDLFADMRNLTWLSLRSNKINLLPDLFKYIPKLSFLELGHNDLHELPNGLFKHLKGLKLLNLWQNSLTNLTGDAFDGLEDLEELDLSSNKLETLPSDIFHKFPKLSLLNLFFNNFSSLPEGLFSMNTQLETLKLDGNMQELKTLPGGLLSNLTKLNEVRFDKCGIQTIGESAFWGSKSIKLISLKMNSLTEIPKFLFRDQVELVHLDLSDNQITNIADETFSALKQLRFLYLNDNRLEKISSNLFSRLVSMELLNMKHNNLQEVAFNAFYNTRALESVDMSYNNLSFMEDNGMTSLRYEETYGLKSPFQKLSTIKYLNLSHNAITELFSDWRISATGLRELDLSFNKMQKISIEDINVLNNNIVIDLRNNNISEVNFNRATEIIAYLSADKNRGSHLVKVLIENNPFHCDCLLYNFILYLEGKLDPLIKSLVTVEPGNGRCTSPNNLEGRLLTDLRPQEMLCFLDNPNHKSKQCPNNCICEVRPFDVSLIVNCSSGNDIETPRIPDIKKLGLHLTELHYENSTLSSLAPLSANQKVYNQVTRLFVGKNNISSLSKEDIPNKIEILDLRNNNIGFVNSSVIDTLRNSTTLEQLWISGNPIECKCDNMPFLAFLQDSFLKIKDFTNVTCSNGKLISKLKRRDLCGTTPAVIAISVFVSLLGLFVGIMAALYYKYQQEIKVWLFAHSLCLWWVTEKELDKDKLYDAFVSFSHKDEDFVVNKLVPELEGGPHPFKICLHFRDWVAGEWIPSQIARSVEDSRRTLIILSPNFLESVWGRMEFKAAHRRALKEGRARVVVVLYGDIGSVDNLDAELQAYLTMNTYVKWGDPWFWDKLRYALPHPQSNKLHAASHNVLNKKGFDDRLELIHPTTPTTPPGQNTPPSHQAHSNPLMNHVNAIPNGLNGVKSPNMINGTITMNGLKVNGNAKHSDV